MVLRRALQMALLMFIFSFPVAVLIFIYWLSF